MHFSQLPVLDVTNASSKDESTESADLRTAAGIDVEMDVPVALPTPTPAQWVELGDS